MCVHLHMMCEFTSHISSTLVTYASSSTGVIHNEGHEKLEALLGFCFIKRVALNIVINGIYWDMEITFTFLQSIVEPNLERMMGRRRVSFFLRTEKDPRRQSRVWFQLGVDILYPPVLHL